MSTYLVGGNFISKVGFAMGCITFSEEELDAAFLDIKPRVLTALSIPELDVTEVVRASLAESLSLAAALQAIRQPDDMELLMKTVGFLKADEDDQTRCIKAVAVDVALRHACEFESASQHKDAADSVRAILATRAEVARTLQACGYSPIYFDVLASAQVTGK